MALLTQLGTLRGTEADELWQCYGGKLAKRFLRDLRFMKHFVKRKTQIN